MNKKNVIFILLALLLLPSRVLAVYDWQPLHQNNLMSSATNYGQLGQVQGGSSAYTFWPAPALDINGDPIPPLMNYVYGWGLWVGAQVRNDTVPSKMDTLVTMGYNPVSSKYEFTPGAVVAGVPQNPTAADVKVYVSSEADWPLKKTSGEDSIISMFDTRCVYNDYNTANHLTGRPLKIEVTQTTYQWNIPSITDVIYFLFEVKNTSEDTLFDVYLAPTTDCDIGFEADPSPNDVCYWDSTTNMGYQYNSINSEPGWTREPGCIGFSFLQGPIATKDHTFPDSFKIYQGDTLGLSCFRILHRSMDPWADTNQYMEIAGYDSYTGTFQRYDNKPAPADQRFIESTGPIDIIPGQTAKVIVCMICANFDYTYLGVNDTMAIRELREKAMAAKIVYENSIVQNLTQITLTAPSCGSVLSGVQTISWTYGGNAAATDSVDLQYSRDEATWDSLAYDQPNNGSYSWNTIAGPDGVRYKISAALHGPQKLAIAISDSFIVVNNPGNAPPEISLTRPDSVISGSYNWQWMAGDADQDEVVASHFVMMEGTGIWQKVIGTLTSNPNNTQLWQEYNYAWNTDSMLDANYRLKTVCYDGQVTVADSTLSYYPLYNPRVHYPGVNTGYSTMPVKWYTYKSSLITGHTYEVRFKPIVRGTFNGLYYPAEYKYDLWDVTNNSLVSSNWVVPEIDQNYYYKDEVGQVYSGFVVHCGDTAFIPGAATFDSVNRPATDPTIDTLYWSTILAPDMKWAKLNSDYEIRWHLIKGGGDTILTNDTLSCEVWDVTYNVQIPADTLPLNNIVTFSWNLGATPGGVGRTIMSATSSNARKWMNLCGMRLYFNNPAHTVLGLNMTWATHPQEGDIWRIYSSGPIPPREGDVYSFTPTGTEGSPNEIAATSLLLQQNAPNPFRQLTAISYQLSAPGQISLKVYNIAGQLVKTLASGQASAGPHTVKWDGRDNSGNKVSSGIYIYRLQVGNKDLTRKLVILR